MNLYEIKKITDLSAINMVDLVEDSKVDGFRFLKRLIDDFESGTNTFSLPGEALYGLFNHDGKILAIGGINQDPYINENKVARLRRFYVSKSIRRTGVGKLLLKNLMSHAEEYFNVIVLHTDTERADRFYRANGFTRSEQYPGSTHYISLQNPIVPDEKN